MRKEAILVGLPEVLERSLGEEHVDVLELTGERDSAEESGQPWLDIKYGKRDPGEWHGVVPANITYRVDGSSKEQRLSVIVKVNPLKGIGETLIPWIIQTKGIELDKPYSQYSAAAEFSGTARREATLYEIAQNEPSLADILPSLYGEITDESTGECALVIERVDPIVGLDASGSECDWSFEQIRMAVEAAARFHAAFCGRQGVLGWAGPRMFTSDMEENASLWKGILYDSHRRFPDIVTEAITARRERIIETISGWHPAKDKMPTTLVHDDYNPRNVGFRLSSPKRVLALDWELVKAGSPLRDVVELLTFSIGTTCTKEEIDALLASYKRASAEAGVEYDDRAFAEAFQAELRVEAINRVGLQAVFGAAFDIPYLARINSAIESLLAIFD
jgi:hydroxymethylglutaryl-CoA reductase (NADPH)